MLRGGALAAAGTAAVAALGWRARLVRAVPPELRAPFLYLPQTLGNRWALRLARLEGGIPSAVHPDAEARALWGRMPGAVPTRVVTYRPAGGAPRERGALLWLHGGGLVLGAAEYDHAWCSRLAVELDLMVVSVDYRLAPEHPFPAAIDDCFTALRWVHAHAGDLGVDPDQVAVGGSSAGGGLAAALAQRARDAGVPVALQLLRYPMLDDRTGHAAVTGARGRLGWTPRSNRFGWGCYLGPLRGAPRLPAYAAPARCDDLSGLPPAWIGVGDLDLFHDECVGYARRLQAAGVPCELLVVPGMYHGADGVRPDAPSMRAFQDSGLRALRRATTHPD